MNRRAVLRAGLGALAAVQLVLGLWILLLPHTFWDLRWVSLIPPYNEHLMRDYGAMNLSLAVVLCAAVSAMERRLTVTALVAYLAFAVPHLVFHAAHLEPLSAASGTGLITLLGLGVVGPAWLLWLSVVPGPTAYGARRVPPVRPRGR